MFEDSLKNLEEMAEKLRDNNTSLDEALKSYETGIKAYEECKKILDDAKGKVEFFEK